MARKGDQAKEVVKAKLKQVFGDDFIGVVDKKIYVQANDGGEMVQVAIALTVPKNPITADEAEPFVDKTTENLAPWEISTTAATPKKSEPVKASAEEQKMVDKLMEQLGIKE